MKVYMLQDVVTLLFYRRKHLINRRWVEQKKAIVWTNRTGPTTVQERLGPGWSTEIKAFNLTEIPCTEN